MTTPFPLESSLLTSAAYDRDTRILRLTFKSGAVYDYFDVPVQVLDRLLHSHSPGSTFMQSIKGHYAEKFIERKKP
jgi:hypothetical protein